MATEQPTPEQIGGWLAAIAGGAVVLRKAAQRWLGNGGDPKWAAELLIAVRENTQATRGVAEKLGEVATEIAVIKDRLR